LPPPHETAISTAIRLIFRGRARIEPMVGRPRRSRQNTTFGQTSYSILTTVKCGVHRGCSRTREVLRSASSMAGEDDEELEDAGESPQVNDEDDPMNPAAWYAEPDVCGSARASVEKDGP